MSSGGLEEGFGVRRSATAAGWGWEQEPPAAELCDCGRYPGPHRARAACLANPEGAPMPEDLSIPEEWKPAPIRLEETPVDDAPAAGSIDADPELWHGLTLINGAPGGLSAQIRRTAVLAPGDSLEVVGEVAQLVLDVSRLDRSTEDGRPHVVSGDEQLRRLRDLLNIATARGYL